MDKEKLSLISPGQIRVRFAPSPTGYLHIGGARTALFNFLFARKYNGSFILRIEDTDLERSKKEYEENIIEALSWLGLEWDEGPDKGGPYGPYRQSERLHIYKKYLEKLLNEGKAYYCFCKKEELEAERQYLLSIGKAPKYSGKCRNLSPQKVSEYLKEGREGVIRLKVDPQKISFVDLIRGKVEVEAELLGDFVIARNLTSPLYNFACVIDDYEMKISHVIRAEEHLSNTPKQILIQKALNFPQPNYAHLPLILAPDRSKLSKRHGATAVTDYKKMGYLPEALINFLAFLGWNPGNDREIYSLSSLVKDFSLERIQKAGAVFNHKKLIFLNGFYIRQKPIEKLTELVLPYLIEAKLIEPLIEEETFPPTIGGRRIYFNFLVVETKEKISLETIQKMVKIYQERLKILSEIVELLDFFFKDKLNYEKKLLFWKDQTEQETKDSLNYSIKLIEKIKNWTLEEIRELFMKGAEEFSSKINKEKGDRGYLLWPLRVALTGKEASAPPFEIMEILGKEKTLKRIKEALKILETK